MPTAKETETDRALAARSVSPYWAGVKGRCPYCGQGSLFKRGLEIRDECTVCGFDLSAADPGDGAQVFVILIMGAIAALVGFALIGGIGMAPWLAMVILMALILVGSIWMLRVFKATLVALQFHHDAREGAMDPSEPMDPNEQNKDKNG